MRRAADTYLENDSAAVIPRPGNGDIAALAHQLWIDRGCPIGSPDEDWFLAEAELTDQQKASAESA